MDEIPLQNLKLQNQIIREELIQAFTKVLDSGNYVSGKEVQNFKTILLALLIQNMHLELALEVQP